MKWIGAALCFAVSVALGMTAGKKERARTEECFAFLTLFTYIQNQIGYFFAPTKMIYRNIQNEVLEGVGFLRALAEHEDDEVYYNVWQDALASCRERLHLTKTQFEIVESFGSCIGKSNEDLQLKSLAYYKEALASEAERQKTEMKKNIKIYRTLGFAVGTAAMILVL